MITANQVVAHMVGDYLLQSDWMANSKTSRSVPAAAHALTYTLPFLLVARSPQALATIAATHFVIDRWRLARHLCWAKNFIAPPGSNLPWAECSGTGYPPARPAWLSVWLMIVADNTVHVILNGLAIRWGQRA